ncbi:MAG: hypothetical protein AUG51_22955 [Acidobacteria bacterium 13_1_20CM_3_53_8]|nr:MAG: hypothetical protein AUG51_22955 [Acidobacteria bacterium 13_1_20CM_3_53_8]
MSFDFIARFNPELARNLRTSLPARRLIFIVGLTLALLLVLGGWQWSYYSNKTYYNPVYDLEAYRIKEFSSEFYSTLVLIMTGALFVLSPAMTALSFIQEKLRGTAIFQQMVLLKPFDLAVGKFLGSGAISYIVVAILFPFSLVAAELGGVNNERILRNCYLLLIGGFCCQAVGLFVSALLANPSARALRGGLLVGPAVGTAGALTLLWTSRYFNEDYFIYGQSWQTLYFYDVKAPYYLLILLVMAFTGVWAFIGAVRMIKASQLIPLASWPAWLFFVTAEVLLVGLLWGEQKVLVHYGSDTNWIEYGTPAVVRLLIYLFFNWAALTILAGSIALGRGRLREWWSVAQDPLSIFQRKEIKSSVLTFLLALGVAETGLFTLWKSFHPSAGFVDERLFGFSSFVPIAFGLAVTVLSVTAFIQYCAMQRFRIGAWAGVMMAVVFYLGAGVAGAMFETQNNTVSLVNPMAYAAALCSGDPHMDAEEYRRKFEPQPEGISYSSNRPKLREVADPKTVLVHGALVEGILAFGCFGLAYTKWRRTRDEMLQEES